MAADNISLNAGSGGANLRTLADSTGLEWPVGVATYATTVSAGANVLQVVTPSAGLPVQQQGTWTVEPGNTPNISPWLFSLSAGGNTATVTTAGAVKVDGSAVTQPVSGTVALGAGTALIGSMAQAAQLGALYSGTTLLTSKFAPIAASASGATTIVAAVAGKAIYVVRYSLSANGTVNVNLQSHTTTSTATGLHYLVQYMPAGGGYCPCGIFATAVGEALDINLSAAIAVGGELTYFTA